VGVFGPLKAAYRAQAEQACRAGVGTIGEPHFTYLYDRDRKEALTPRNIRSAWLKSGLFPFFLVKGCSRIDSIVLGQHAVYNNLEERKEKRAESVPALNSVGSV
jgi:hypothetical protein